MLKLLEVIKLPIELGDTIKMGKFKNKKVVVKTIHWDDNGNLEINGKKALTFRIEKLMKGKNEKVKVKKAEDDKMNLSDLVN